MEYHGSDRNARIVILVDDLATDGLLSEHGFSLWIDTGYERILFDTGQNVALASNAPKLNIDCSRADHLVLSHGHYDHAGGLCLVLDHAPQIHVYCHPGVLQTRYSIHRGTSKPINMPRASGVALDRLPEKRLHWVLQPTMISARVGLSGPIPQITAYEDTGGPFYLDPEGRRIDPIEDDLALWIRTGKGLVVCLGCCHAGLINTLHHILHLNPGERIHAVIGGFHMLHADNNRLQHTMSDLRKLSPDSDHRLPLYRRPSRDHAPRKSGRTGVSGCCRQNLRLQLVGWVEQSETQHETFLVKCFRLV